MQILAKILQPPFSGNTYFYVYCVTRQVRIFVSMKRLSFLIFLISSCVFAFAQSGEEDAYSIAERQFFQADYGAAIRTALDGLQQEPAKSSEESAAELYSILGASYSRLGAFDKASEYFVRCYEFDKKSDNPEGMSSSLINLASMYVYAGKPELAEKEALEAIAVEKPLGRPAKLAMAYGKACDVYHALKQDCTALEYADLAVKTAMETEDPGAIAIRKSQRAYPLLALGRYKEAAEDLDYAEKVFQENGNRQSLAIVYYQQAGLHEKFDRNTLSTSYYRKALDLARELPDKPLEQRVCLSFANHLKGSNPKEAYELLDRSSILQAEIAKSDSDKALELFNIEYDTAKKEERIAAQEKDIQDKRNTIALLFSVLSILIIAAGITAITAVHSNRVKKELKQSNDQKDFLLKVISHDIMSPSIAMLRGIQMLRSHSKIPEDAQSSEVLAQLERQAESEVELIGNAVKWVQNKDGSSSGETTNFNVVDMVREAIVQYREIAGQKGIAFEQDFGGDSIIVCCNRNHLLFALRNLLSNAIKFSNPDSVVKVHLQPENGRVNLSVEDFGIGIPADKLDAIYSSEATFRRSGTSGEPSHGIGLAVSRELVASIGGKLTVHSAEGKGSIFTITIPGGGSGD